MPLANRTTAANGSEREQILPLIDSIKIQTGKLGRPRKRYSVLAADKGLEDQLRTIHLDFVPREMFCLVSKEMSY